MKNNIREQVIESAAQIFAENEFADVSLEHITAIAGAIMRRESNFSVVRIRLRG